MVTQNFKGIILVVAKVDIHVCFYRNHGALISDVHYFLFPVGNSRDGWTVSLHYDDVGLHALVHLPAQPACSSLEHL